jgi:DNA-directed RNA polymerase beta subunit
MNVITILFFKILRLGLFPMMTDRTSFIINGNERIILEKLWIYFIFILYLA